MATTRSIPVRSFLRATRGQIVLILRRGRFYTLSRSKTPNAATRRALRDAEARRNLLGPFDDVDRMFRELGA